jgi:hypothetical protein
VQSSFRNWPREESSLKRCIVAGRWGSCGHAGEVVGAGYSGKGNLRDVVVIKAREAKESSDVVGKMAGGSEGGSGGGGGGVPALGDRGLAKGGLVVVPKFVFFGQWGGR